ncbi:hypothetical protein CDAR_65681 [Caerostris darwini]|uniref:Uncharacterized protein n=1 Tax=Caerostris darwini TaxID=1538125 RepID=A0AAV4UC26_9ARAC|nr:hypothetical protein CDAR_65681 [Caerostris darwini]
MSVILNVTEHSQMSACHCGTYGDEGSDENCRFASRISYEIRRNEMLNPYVNSKTGKKKGQIGYPPKRQEFSDIKAGIVIQNQRKDSERWPQRDKRKSHEHKEMTFEKELST